MKQASLWLAVFGDIMWPELGERIVFALSHLELPLNEDAAEALAASPPSLRKGFAFPYRTHHVRGHVSDLEAWPPKKWETQVGKAKPYRTEDGIAAVNIKNASRNSP